MTNSLIETFIKVISIEEYIWKETLVKRGTEYSWWYTGGRSLTCKRGEQFLTGLDFHGRVEEEEEEEENTAWRLTKPRRWRSNARAARAVPFDDARRRGSSCPVLHKWERMHMFRINQGTRIRSFNVNAWRSSSFLVFSPFFHSRKNTILVSIKYWVTQAAVYRKVYRFLNCTYYLHIT